ncbi:MAG: tetratricopeptide repeat protein [Verrucomicrobiia bacterium]
MTATTLRGCSVGAGGRALVCGVHCLQGLLLVFLWCLISAPAIAAGGQKESALAAFEEANRLYEQAKYEEAAAAYLKILDSGVVSPAVYFNLGNAYFKSGQLGRAIVSYRKAQQLAPRDPDIRANLQFVRATVGGGSAPTQPFWQRVVTRLNLDEWAILTAGALWLFGGLQALRQLVQSPFFERRLLTIALLLLLVLCLVGLGCGWHLAAQPWAVVVKPDAVLHHGPLEESPSVQVLQDGQELIVVDEKDDWVQVEGAARGIGWLHKSNVALMP